MYAETLGNGSNIAAWSKSAQTYDGLYGGLPLHVVDRVTAAIDRVLAHKNGATTSCKEITLLDYGCGTGRYLPLLEKIATEKKIHIRYLALDAVPAMLEKTASRAMEAGYAPLEMRNSFPVNDTLHATYSSGHRGPAYKKVFGESSVTIQLIQPNIIREMGDKGPVATPDFLKEVLLNEPIDISLCMFGVLSYCQKQSVRQSILKVLNEVTDGPILVSSPTPQRDPEAFARYTGLREEYFNPQTTPQRREELEAQIRDATEHGNTYISFPGARNPATGEVEMVENLYHFYDHDQFMQDMQAGGLQHIHLGCVNKRSEAEITQTLSSNLQDYLASIKLRPQEYDQKGMFLFCDALSSRAAAEGMAPANPFFPPKMELITRLENEIRANSGHVSRAA